MRLSHVLQKWLIGSWLVGIVVAVTPAMARVLESPAGSYQPDDRFGRALAVVDGRILVGAPQAKPTGGVRAGTAYLYEPRGALVATLLLPGSAAAGDDFGAAVAGAGQLLLVGAPGADADGKVDAGRAFVFDAQGNLVVELVAPSTAPGDAFGFAVSGIGPGFAVGAPGVDDAAPDAGAIYVFGSNGQFQRTVTAQGLAEANDAFGYAIAAYGNDFIGGAPRPGTRSPGVAYLVDARDGGIIAAFHGAPGTPADRFGSAVGTEGGNILVGAPLHRASGQADGVVWRFVLGSPERALPIPSPGRAALYGTAIARAQGQLLVGAPGLASGTATFGGALLDLDSLPATALLGSAVAGDAQQFAIGAPGVGRVYLPVCGDAQRDPGEQCDGTDDAACPGGCHRTACTCGPPIVCGDGRVTGGEECDDGDTTPCDGCSETCRVEVGANCGDGILNRSCERCDDGNRARNDGCSRACEIECSTPGDCADPAGFDDTCLGPAACVQGECDLSFAAAGTTCGAFTCCDGRGGCSVTCGLPCDDGQTFCTEDVFDPILGCLHLSRCDDNDTCTRDLCDPERGCSNIPDFTDPRCDCGSPLGDSVAPAIASTVRVLRGCSCTLRCAVAGDCDDGDPCTDEVCMPSGRCCYAEHSCDDGNICTKDSCDPDRGCTYETMPLCCSDDGDCDNVCRVGGDCEQCEGCEVLSYGRPCCTRAVELRAHCMGGDIHNGRACNVDGDLCTEDLCQDGSCLTARTITCDDHNPCTRDACNPVEGCRSTPEAEVSCGTICQPGTCDMGTCVLGDELNCDDGNDCTTDSCDPDRPNPCVHEGISECCGPDHPCIDIDSCTLNERCVDGECMSDAVVCAPGGPCEDQGRCLPQSGCEPRVKDDGSQCEYRGATDPCLEGDAICQSGVCGLQPVCDVTVGVDGAVTIGQDCERSARGLEIVVDCATFGAASTSKKSRRGFCRAEAQIAKGSARHTLDAFGYTRLELRLKRKAAKRLCAVGRLEGVVRVKIRDRAGVKRTVDRAVVLPTNAIPSS